MYWISDELAGKTTFLFLSFSATMQPYKHFAPLKRSPINPFEIAQIP
jgi:hypothetical protein